jgi:hypothetical protein
MVASPASPASPISRAGLLGGFGHADHTQRLTAAAEDSNKGMGLVRR